MLRVLVFLPFVVIGNCPFVVIWGQFEMRQLELFNLYLGLGFLIVNFLDLSLIQLLKRSRHNLARWFFIHKFIPWDNSAGLAHLAISRQNKFLVRNCSFFSLPLWTPLVTLPIWFCLLGVPLIVGGIISIIMLDLPIIYSTSIWLFITPFCLAIANIYFKNLNDYFRVNHNHFLALEREIAATLLDTELIVTKKETWTHGWGKIVLLLISLGLFALALVGFTIASFNLFDEVGEYLGQSVYGSFRGWRILLLPISPLGNAIAVGIGSALLLIWSFTLWGFCHLPWYLLLFWKRGLLIFNFITLNFLAIFFWSLRFNDEKKDFQPAMTNLIPVGKAKKQPAAVRKSVVKPAPSVVEEQVITRVIPLELIDEEE
ncbi:hypothetical protein [Mycoplasma sp. ATU-Cv-703]|uniref:hypothetical protein n=1 Tax=Mycoplasma sp. ATU-Cv-703 TaxID=2498595 RepID=UPI001374A6F4